MQKRGINPEELPAAEDVKKVQRKLKGDENKLIKETKKIKKSSAKK